MNWAICRYCMTVTPSDDPKCDCVQLKGMPNPRVLMRLRLPEGYDLTPKVEPQLDSKIETGVDTERWLKQFALSLNRRAEVEQELLDMAHGKAPLPSTGKCNELAMRLGVSSTWKGGELDGYRIVKAELFGRLMNAVRYFLPTVMPFGESAWANAVRKHKQTLDECDQLVVKPAKQEAKP